MACSRSLALGALTVHLTKCSYSSPLNTSEELLKFLKDCYELPSQVGDSSHNSLKSTPRSGKCLR